jgi:hypothetical protein
VDQDPRLLTFHICWGAQAALYYHYGIQKRLLPEKLFGVFRHTVDYRRSILFRGFDDVFYVPHSRHTTVLPGGHRRPCRSCASSPPLPEAGVYAMFTKGGRQIFIMGHSEYDADTLKPGVPAGQGRRERTSSCRNYFPFDDPAQEPRGHLAGPRQSAVLQLAELLRLPDHALRPPGHPLQHPGRGGGVSPPPRRRAEPPPGSGPEGAGSPGGGAPPDAKPAPGPGASARPFPAFFCVCPFSCAAGSI